MKIEDVQIVGRPLVLATAAEVDALESRLWITFPAGYREYVTALGEGILVPFVRIYPPWRVENELADWRKRIHKYWFWDDGAQLLPRERALECVIVGDTMNGDELVFHPTRPGHLFVLPRDSEQVFDAGPDLLTAIDWLCSSGELVEPFSERDFEPFDTRKQAAESVPGEAKIIDPEGESLDELIELGKQWAQRHNARKLAQADLKSNVAVGQTSKLLYEALALDGEYPTKEGYLAVFEILDKATKLEVATYAWHKDEGSYGASLTPNQANLAKIQKKKS